MLYNAIVIMQAERLHFPEDFLWGASTAGFQNEGDEEGLSDWGAFVENNAVRLAREACPEKDYGNGPLPPEFWRRVEPFAKNPENYRAGEACGWWDGLWQEDLDLAKSLGLNALRFSIERYRVEPTPDGAFDQKALRHYQDLIQGCKDRGMEPVVTLFHYANPLWVARRGGWENPEIVTDFPLYAARLVRALDGSVRNFVVLNEPDVFSFNGWVSGTRPPEKKYDWPAARRVRNHLIAAHKRAFDSIKQIQPDAQVSSALNFTHVEPRTGRPSDVLGAYLYDKLCNCLFLPRMVDHMDFIAVNHYHHDVKEGLNPARGHFRNPPDEPRSDQGLFLNPESIYHALRSLAGYEKEVIITENGLADKEDILRPWFIRENLRSVLRAIADGIDVRGYFYWTLTDNFEWNQGFWPRYGLIGKGYKQKRTVRRSAEDYSQIIRSGIVE